MLVKLKEGDKFVATINGQEQTGTILFGPGRVYITAHDGMITGMPSDDQAILVHLNRMGISFLSWGRIYVNGD